MTPGGGSLILWRMTVKEVMRRAAALEAARDARRRPRGDRAHGLRDAAPRRAIERQRRRAAARGACATSRPCGRSRPPRPAVTRWATPCSTCWPRSGASRAAFRRSGSNAALADAWGLMSDSHMTHLPVADDHDVIGMVSLVVTFSEFPHRSPAAGFWGH